MNLVDILILYLVFRVKQVVCDFFLQTSWMANEKGKPFDKGGLAPLFSHAGIHGIATTLIMIKFAPFFWWLGGVDFLIHGMVDKFKAAITKKYGWTPKDTMFWWSFGLDQEAHNLTHVAYIIIIVMSYPA